MKCFDFSSLQITKWKGRKFLRPKRGAERGEMPPGGSLGAALGWGLDSWGTREWRDGDEVGAASTSSSPSQARSV